MALVVQPEPTSDADTEFNQVEANKLVAELLDMAFQHEPITLNDVARARELRDTCGELGILCGLTGDGCTLMTVEEAWDDIVSKFLDMPGGGPNGEWSALRMPVGEANILFEVGKRHSD